MPEPTRRRTPMPGSPRTPRSPRLEPPRMRAPMLEQPRIKTPTKMIPRTPMLESHCLLEILLLCLKA